MRETSENPAPTAVKKPFRLLVRSAGHKDQQDLPKSGDRHCAVFAELGTSEPLGLRECMWISDQLTAREYESVVIRPSEGWKVHVRFRVAGHLNEIQMQRELDTLEQQIRDLHHAYLAQRR